MAIYTINFYCISGFAVELAIAMSVLLEMAIGAMHSFLKVNVLKVHGFVELVFVCIRNQVIFAVEKVAFNTSYFAAMLGHHFAGGGEAGASQGMSTIIGVQFNSLSRLGFWIGLAFAAIFLAGAVRLRRNQGPI